MRAMVYGQTDTGRVRAANEDSHGWWIPRDEAEQGRRGLLLAVADGMGGASAGEEASKLAISTLLEAYQGGPGLDPMSELVEAMHEANAAVYAAAQSHPDWRGMGTTCTALVVLERDLLVAQVGDSRAYLLTGDEARRLTRDHSLVAELVDQGKITAEEARVHPRRNVVTRAVGVAAQVEVESMRWPGIFVPGTTVLLCSDGLHGVLEDAEIVRLVSDSSLEAAGGALIQAANQGGGPDNITVVLSRPAESRKGEA
jgi:PPM family protein phosphatase